MKSPQISIIVPVYNAADSLRHCLDSIRSQTYDDYEIIIVDDGSEDASASIADEYAKSDSSVRVKHKANGGVSSARNAGMEMAKGRYLAFVDADDTIGENRIKAMAEGIGDADMLISGLTIIDEKGTKTERRLSYVSDAKSLMIAMMEDALYGYIVTKLVKKSIIDAHGIRFDESIHWREDDVFVTDYLAHATTFAIIPDAEYYYMLPPASKTYKDSASTQCTERLLEGYEKIYGGEIPDRVCQLQAWAIEGEAERQLLLGTTPSERLLKYYKRATSTDSGRPLTKKIKDCIILRSRSYRRLSIWLMKAVHRVFSISI